VLRDVARILISIANNRDYIVAARNLVVLEPIIERLRDARTVLLNICDGVDERCNWVIDVDDENFPVGFSAVVGCDAA